MAPGYILNNFKFTIFIYIYYIYLYLLYLLYFILDLTSKHNKSESMEFQLIFTNNIIINNFDNNNI